MELEGWIFNWETVMGDERERGRKIIYR
jgi:hypothetical protein